MSLLSNAMTKVVMLDKVSNSDGVGGIVTSFIEGAEFEAAVTLDTSIEARTAEAQGVTSLYTVTTRKGVVLQYHDVFRRVGDGKIFRVTSDGDDKATPNGAGLDMRQVTAEEWSIS